MEQPNDVVRRAYSRTESSSRARRVSTAALLSGAFAGIGGITHGLLHRQRWLVWASVGVGGTLTTAGVVALVREGRRMRHVAKSITIARPREEVYGFWRDLENLPRFMSHIEKVERLDSIYSRWEARGPGGHRFTWEAEIVEERPGEMIRWRSLPGSRAPHRGAVYFRDAPGGRGTELTAVLEYRPPFGPLGRFVAAVLGEEPHQQLTGDLRSLKQLLEAG